MLRHSDQCLEQVTEDNVSNDMDLNILESHMNTANMEGVLSRSGSSKSRDSNGPCDIDGSTCTTVRPRDSNEPSQLNSCQGTAMDLVISAAPCVT